MDKILIKLLNKLLFGLENCWQWMFHRTFGIQFCVFNCCSAINKLRSHRMKPLFHHCIIFASKEKNCCKEADLLKHRFTLDALLLK